MDSLEEKIYTAFWGTTSFDTDPIPNRDVEELIEMLPDFTRAGVAGLLPLALVRAKQIHSDRILGKGGELLVTFLDGRLSQEKENPEFKKMRRNRQYMFNPFSKEQCLAVIAWLEEVAEPRYGAVCRNTIDSALAFWTAKAKRK